MTRNGQRGSWIDPWLASLPKLEDNQITGFNFVEMDRVMSEMDNATVLTMIPPDLQELAKWDADMKLIRRQFFYDLCLHRMEELINSVPQSYWGQLHADMIQLIKDTKEVIRLHTDE